MVARAFGDDDKVSTTGDTMTGPLVFEGSPPFTVAQGIIGGLVTLNGTAAVTVATPAVDSDSIVLLAVQPAVAPVGVPWVASITPGTGFTVKSTSTSDTAVLICWYVVETA